MTKCLNKAATYLICNRGDVKSYDCSSGIIEYLKNLCQLHFLVVEDGMNTVNSLLGLVRGAPLGLLMQDRNQSPDGQTRTSD